MSAAATVYLDAGSRIDWALRRVLAKYLLDRPIPAEHAETFAAIEKLTRIDSHQFPTAGASELFVFFEPSDALLALAFAMSASDADCLADHGSGSNAGGSGEPSIDGAGEVVMASPEGAS